MKAIFIRKAIHKKYSYSFQPDHAASFDEFLRHFNRQEPGLGATKWTLGECSGHSATRATLTTILKLDTIEEDSDYLFNRLNIDTIDYPKGNKIIWYPKKGYGAVASSDVWKEVPLL